MVNKKFKKFSKEKDLELSRKFKEENNKYALSQLIEINMWLVVRIAYRFMSRGIELDDLIQAGSIGLYKAAKKFDYKKKFRLSTFSAFWIRRYITLEIIKKRNIHIPSHIQEDYLNIYKTKNFLEEKFGKKVSVQEISNETGISIEKIKFIYEKMNMHCASLDDSVKFKKNESSGNKQKSEIIGDISFYSAEQLLILKEELNRIMKIVLNTTNQFPKKNKSIFYEHFVYNKTFKEIAQDFSCCYSNIAQHIEKILIAMYVRLKKNGYKVQKNKTKDWLSEKFDLCCWLQETTGANFNILEYKEETTKQ